MKLAQYLMPFILAIVFVAPDVYAQDRQSTAFDRELNSRDDQPLREFVESKENIDVKEKASNLDISGDVRFEWRSIREKGVVYYKDPYCYCYYCDDEENPASSPIFKNYRALRGGSHVDDRGLPISLNDFDVEFNLKFKYSYKKAWCYAHVQFDNPAGIRGRNECFGVFPVFNKEGSEVVGTLPRDSRWALKGSGDAFNINLKRAYIGYNILADGKHRLDIEFGRRKLDDVFDSEIEFTSRFDGILLKYASSIDGFSDWYLDGGVFVVDERVNHFGWVAEIGLIDVMDSGLDLRYNIIDWQKHGWNRCFAKDPYGARFLNSQVTVTYTIHPKFGSKNEEIPIEFYGGFLINHLAKGELFTHGRKKNLGWYAGVYVGSVHQEGDWSLDFEYVVVQAQAVAEYDVGSIGRGNILNENLLDILDESFPCACSDSSSIPFYGIEGIFPRRGNTNFIGYRAEFLYAITDNFSIDVIYEMSNEEDRRIGGRHRYSDFEIEAIYAF